MKHPPARTLAASTLCASQQPLPTALERVRALGFDAIDLPTQEGWAHVDPSALADDTAATTRWLRETLGDIDIVSLNAGTGAEGGEELRRVRALIDLAQEIEAPVITLPAARVGAGALRDDMERTRSFVRAAQGTGVTITLETHRGTEWEDPRTVIRYLEEVPELRVTLDPSHFTTGPHSHLGFSELLPAVRHVHLRSGGDDPSQIQVPAGEGVLPESELLEMLANAGYEGDLTVEYVDTIDGVDALAETGRMRELILASPRTVGRMRNSSGAGGAARGSGTGFHR